MNIGIVTTWFERGAAYVSRQYREVLENNHNVFIYARGGEVSPVGDPVWDDARVTWAPKAKISVPTAIDLDHFKHWLEENQIELVFFNEQHWWKAVIFCNQLGLKTGAYVDYYTEQTVPFFANYDFLICNTHRHYSVFSWHPQCYYVPWGTDIEVFKPKDYEPVNPGLVTFFHSCGVSPERKGTAYVLEAFAGLENRAKLVIHAQCDLLQKLPEHAQRINNLHIQGCLEYIGETVPAPGLFHLGDVYLYPTKLDGLGLTVIEALACGLPVIASDNGPMNEFIDAGQSGRVVKIERMVSRSDGYYWPQCWVDTADLRQQILWYIEQGAAIADHKRAARAYAEAKLNWHKNAAHLPQVFAEIKKLDSVLTAESEAMALRFEENRLRPEEKDPALFSVAARLTRVVKAVNRFRGRR